MTVVTKLLLIAQADKAFFGEKDYQQLLVIRRLAQDLNIPSEIIGCPTFRQAGGWPIPAATSTFARRPCPSAQARGNTASRAAALAGW